MRGVLEPIHELDAATAAAWGELAAAPLEPNPFFDPRLATAAARHLPGGEKDRLLAVYDGEAMVLALPVRRVARYRRVPMPTLVGWGHAHSYLDTPLVAGADPAGAFACALDVAAGAGARWLVLESSPCDGPVRKALDTALGRRGGQAAALLPYERPVVRRREAPTYLDGRLSGQRRKKLRRQRRRLEEHLGPVRIRDLAGTDFDRGLERFLAQEQAGWKGQEGTALASDVGPARFFREGMGAFAQAGRAQAWVLEAGDATVATLCAVVGGRGAFHVKTAYDERHARLSPGVQLELGVLEAFHADPGLDWIDSCTEGEDSPSGLLYPDRRPMQTLVVPLDEGARLGARALRQGLRWRARLARDDRAAEP